MIDWFQWFVIFSVITLVGGFGLGRFILWVRKQEEKKMYGEVYKGNSLVDGTWICKECGAFNAPYLKRCGRCFGIKNKKNEE